MEPEDVNTDENDKSYMTVPQHSVIHGEPINNSQPQYIPPSDSNNYSYPQYSVPQTNDYQSYENTNQNETVSQANKTPDMYETLSFLAWFLFISCKLNYFVKKMKLNSKSLYYRPLLYNDIFMELITIIISSLGFFIYVKKIIYNKDQKLYKSLFTDLSKYHFVPLLLYSTLKIIFESFGAYPPIQKISRFTPREDDGYDAFDLRAYYTFMLLFSIFTLSSFIFLYIKTKMNCDWYINMTFKKGIYSIIIFESCFTFFESIFGLRYKDALDDENSIYNLYKTGGIFFYILIACFAITFSFYFKDLIILILNTILYLGLAIHFFGTKGPDDDDKEILNGSADGILAILIAIASLALIPFMIIKYKEQLIEA